MPHDAEMREQRSDLRQLPAAPDQTGAPRRHLQPLGRRIDQDEPGDAIGLAGPRSCGRRNCRTNGRRKSRDRVPRSRSSSAASSSTIRVKVRRAGRRRRSTRGRRDRRHTTRVNDATAGCTIAQLSEDAAMPDSSTTIGCAGAAAHGMEAVATDIDQGSRRRKLTAIACRAPPLIERADQQDREPGCEQRHLSIVDLSETRPDSSGRIGELSRGGEDPCRRSPAQDPEPRLA